MQAAYGRWLCSLKIPFPPPVPERDVKAIADWQSTPLPGKPPLLFDIVFPIPQVYFFFFSIFEIEKTDQKLAFYRFSFSFFLISSFEQLYITACVVFSVASEFVMSLLRVIFPRMFCHDVCRGMFLQFAFLWTRFVRIRGRHISFSYLGKFVLFIYRLRKFMCRRVFEVFNLISRKSNLNFF